MFDPQVAYQKATSSVSVLPNPSSGGFDPQKSFETQSSSGFDPQKSFEQIKPLRTGPKQGSKSATGNIFGDIAVGAADYALSKSAQKKTIPQGIFDDAVLGIGKVQGWCGVYAGKISTAMSAGDTWNQKKATFTKYGSQEVKAGYKVLIPLGVTQNKDGSYNGYGHFVVPITDPDENGNFYVAQSNADGRQKSNDDPTPGVATYGIYNVNDLKKRYGSNWGAIPGELKVNPFANGKNGTSIQARPGESTSEKQPGGNWVTGLINKAANATGATKALNNAIQQTQLTNDQAPPIVMNIKDPQVLANWVIKNNIGDLQSKRWWVDSPVKGQAWDLITAAQGKGDTGKRFTVDQKQEISQGTGKTNDFVQSVQDLLDPNGYLHAKNAAKDVRANLYTTGKTVVDRVDKKINQSTNPFINNLIGKAIGGAVSGIGQGMVNLAGGESGEDVRVAEGIKNIVFGTAGIINPGVAAFNVATNIPGVDQVAEAVFSGVGTANQSALDLVGIKKGEFRDLLNTALEFGEFAIAHKVLTGVKEVALNKTVKYTPEQVRSALSDITSGNKTKGVPEKLRAKVKELIAQSAKGVAQKEMLRRSFKEGLTVKQARDFVAWFNKFFKTAPVEKASPQFQKLLTDGKKAETGAVTPVQFVSEARELMAKGDTARIRDNTTALNVNTPKALIPGEDGKMMLDKVAEEKTRLNELQQAGSKEVVKVDADAQPVLSVKTFDYSDGKTGVGFTVTTDQGSVQQSISGAFDSPKAAVESVLPKIEEIVSKNSDIASEAIRQKIDELETTNLAEIPTSHELLPWDQNYIPKEVVDVKDMSREMVQKNIDEMVTKYVEETLKPTGYKGVTQGGLARDEFTGEVVGRLGRVSNNPEWYQKAVKDNGGRQPTMKQLREIAVDHLMHGVEDSSIGQLPPDKSFVKLMQSLATAKPEKATMSGKAVGEVKGTGEKNVRGLSLSVEEKAIEHGLTTRMSELPEYKTVKMEDQAQKAQELLKKDPEKAKKIALGIERPPEGILPESVFVAVENEAIKNGDITTLTQLARESGLSAEATTMGQRLRTLAERDPESPVGAFESIIRAREQAIERRLSKMKKGPKTVKAAREKIVNDIKKSIKKSAPTKQSWTGFIESLKC